MNLNRKKINNFLEISERDINNYLLSIDNYKHRTIENNKLLKFFSFLNKKKIIPNNPVNKIEYKEFSIHQTDITLADHKNIFKKINLLCKNDVEIGLLAILIYFHCLSSKQIGNIKLNDISLENKSINIPNRALVYLLENEYKCLITYLEINNEIIENRNIKSLFLLLIEVGLLI